MNKETLLLTAPSCHVDLYYWESVRFTSKHATNKSKLYTLSQNIIHHALTACVLHTALLYFVTSLVAALFLQYLEYVLTFKGK